MSSIYCSQSHENPPGSRFCRLCGEKLALNSQGYFGLPLAEGTNTTLGLRYRVKRQLGHGGFGRTYLAEDLNRFNEPCVLKEFAPQVHGTYALQKAEELFEREAGVLYKLQHPQIPRFRELFRADFEKQAHLFLVQDYVEGQTYRQLLDARKLQGLGFTEPDVMQLLIQLLPVLQYIHNTGVIHRDISPDNLILRYSDQLPVLIDFGGVKQVAVAVSQYVQENQGYGQGQPVSAPETRLGKVGYAPEEQMQLGRAYPHSDLYALATTVLVLLTGKEPQEFLVSLPRRNWGQELNLSPTLGAVLERMRSPRPHDRYQSAEEVMQALGVAPVDFGYVQTQAPPSYIPSLSPDPEMQGTLAIAPSSPPHAPAPPTPHPHTPPHRGFGFGKLLLVLSLVSGSAGAGWWATTNWLLPEEQPSDPPVEEAVEPGSDESPRFSEAEQTRKAELQAQREDLGIAYEFYVNLANATFYERYPDQRGRTLTDGPEDEEWRSRWDAIAAEWLDILEDNFSSEALEQLGSYDEGDREQWKQQANQLYVGSRSLYDLADAEFFRLFPEAGEDFINQPIGQVWQAIVFDRLKALQDGSMLEQVQFDTGAYSEQFEESLDPGEGRVYTANLSEGQVLRLNLDAPSDTTQLSVYLPRPTSELPALLEDSTDRRWSGKLPQSGFYEVVVVSTASESIDYQLDLEVDSVTSSLEPEEPEAPEAKN